MAMEFFISIAGNVAECIVKPIGRPIGRQFGYILYYKENLATMKTDVEKLEGTKDSVQHTVDEARRNGEEIENIVQNWLNKVDNIVAEANKLIYEDHAKAQCSMGHFPNMCTRYKLSRNSKKMLQEISQVLAEGKFDRISYRAASQVTVPPSSRGYEALDSRTSMLNDIMMELKNPNIFIIGVYGLGGVGKTTLVKELARQVKNDGSFDAVVMATITRLPDLENIQGQIADSLDLKLNKESKEGRAAQLWKRITKEKSILVILDDIWGRLDLEEVGIPFGDDHKGCKLVVTSRFRNVLTSNMGTQKEFGVDLLLDGDSWKLFEKMAGDVVQDFNIKPIAVEVAKCCAGLPVLIVTVAKALRKKNVSEWKDALNELRRSDQEGLLQKEVYPTLELTYKYLESDELRLLFLFIGSSGVADIHTAELFLCSWGFGIYSHALTLADARNRFYKLINDLKASSLLLESETEWVRMHDVVRKVATSISSKDLPTYAVDRYTEMKEWSKIDQIQKLVAIIIPWSFIHELPERLDCPELKLLVLQTIGGSLKIPDEFFSVTRKLKVLDLYGMMLTPSPPPSIRLLTNIQSLALYGCKLGDISIVAELKSLQILSLEKSDITDLPKEIGQLANLRMLNLSHCFQLKFIPANLLSSLTCLEELYMGNCFIQWDVKGSKDHNNNASLDELSNLSHLTTLDIMIQDASVWPRDLQVFKKLERYNIFIGDIWEWSLFMAGGASKSSRTLKLMETESSSILLDDGLNFLLNSAEDMCLAGLQHSKDVLFELNMEGFPQLKHLCIQDSAELKFIINTMGWIHPHPAFLSLENLVLKNLFNLQEICHGPIPIQSLTKLKSLKVKGCEKLKFLLSHPLVRDLPQLLEIKISDCKMITEIVAVQTSEADKENKIVFPKLRSLQLKWLPSLIGFCSVPLTAAQSTPLGLKSLVPSSVLFGNLEQLMVSYCAGLENIMKSSVVNNIQKLRIFYIDGCENIEEIIASDDENDASEIAFMKLEHLHLSNLPRLRSFCKGKHGFKFPQLQYLLVEDCPMMETFSHGVLYAPKLRAVHVNDGDEDEWHWNGDINSTITKIAAEKGNVYKINISNHDSNVMDNQNSNNDSVCPQNLNEDSSR